MNNDAYTLELLYILKNIPEAKRDAFINRYASQARNPTVIFGLNAFLGTFGIDRFFLGQPVLGILKLLTLGGLGVWVLVDCFLVGGIARSKNVELARIIANS